MSDLEFDTNFTSQLELLFKTLIQDPQDPTVFSETDKIKLSDALKILDKPKKIFIMENITKFYDLDVKLIDLINGYSLGKLSTISQKYIANIYRLQRNILLTFIKENIPNDCTEDIKKLFEISNEKFKIANTILTDYYNDNTVKKPSTVVKSDSQPVVSKTTSGDVSIEPYIQFEPKNTVFDVTNPTQTTKDLSTKLQPFLSDISAEAVEPAAVKPAVAAVEPAAAAEPAAAEPGNTENLARKRVARKQKATAAVATAATVTTAAVKPIADFVQNRASLNAMTVKAQAQPPASINLTQADIDEIKLYFGQKAPLDIIGKIPSDLTLKEIPSQVSQKVAAEIIKKNEANLNAYKERNKSQLSEGIIQDRVNPMLPATAVTAGGSAINNIQMGGEPKSLIESIYQIGDLYNILKSDIMIYVITLMSDKDKFNDAITKISKVEKLNIVKPFFIDVSSYTLIVPEIKKFESTIQTKIERDTKIYKTFDTVTNANYIFGYTILHNIIKIVSDSSNNIDLFLTGANIATQFYNLLVELAYNIKFIKLNLYDSLNTQYTFLKTEHAKYINSLSQVYTYIKYRNDSPITEINDRFKIKEVNESGENKNKYLLIKYNNYDTKKDSLKEEYYYTGPFNDIFDTTTENTKIAEKCNIIVQKLKSNKSVCIIGYGQSGSGKTSTLIQLNKKVGTETTREKGIIIELLNLDKISETFDNINVEYKNIYINHKFGLQPNSISTLQDQEKYFVTTSIGTKSDFKYVSSSSDKGWKNGTEPLGDSILNAFNNRQIEPSPNNPDSSRSHVIVIMTLTKSSDITKSSKLIICDFAGVENKFLCTDLKELYKFETQYNKSNKYKEKSIKYDQYKCIEEQEIKKYTPDEQNEINKNCGKFKDLTASKLVYIGKFLKEKSNPTIADYIKYLEEQKNKIVNKDKIELLLLTKEMLKTVEKSKDKKQYELNKDLYAKFKEKYGLNDDKVINFLSKPTTDDDIGKIYFNKTSSTHLFNIQSKEWNPIKEQIKKDDSSRLKDDKKIIKVFKLLNSYIKNTEIPKTYTETDITTYETAIKTYENEERRLDMIKYNCKSRVEEGYMINQTLRDFKENIREIIKHKLSSKLPLFFDQDIFPYCRNHNFKNEIFEDFYDIKPYTDNKNRFLLNILKTEGINILELDFFIFTVINLTPTANNPPNPPYINLNNLIYHAKNKNLNEKNKLIKEFMSNLENYEFYKNLAEFQDIRDSINTDISEEGIQKFITTIRKVIENNNELTLIGTLQTTDSYKHFINSDLVCSHYDTDHEDLQRKEHNKNTLRHILDAAKIDTNIKDFNIELK